MLLQDIYFQMFNRIDRKIGALILSDKGELLIAKKRGQEVWISVGGKIEEGESNEECLEREISEELGVQIVGIPEYYCETGIEEKAHNPSEGIHISFYLVKIQDEPQPNFEIEKIKWVKAKQAIEIADNSQALRIATGLQKFAIPNLIADNLLR